MPFPIDIDMYVMIFFIYNASIVTEIANSRYNSFENNDVLIAVAVRLRSLNIVLNIGCDVEVRIKALVAQGWE